MRTNLEWTNFGELSFLHHLSWTEAGFVHGFLGASVDSRGERVRCDSLLKSAFPELLAIHRLNQTHSTLIAEASGENASEADAWYLEHAGTREFFGIETADCAPVILRSRINAERAVLHCGWRGTCAGLLLKTLARFRSSPADIEMSIGPAAKSCCYEVGEEFVSSIRADWSAAGLQSRGGKDYFDLATLLREQAEAFGLPNRQISAAPECTICDFRFFSFRRQKADSGRQLTFISSESVI